MASRTVVALLRGGLGNQLFIAAASSLLGKSLGLPIRLMFGDLPHGGLQIEQLLPPTESRSYVQTPWLIDKRIRTAEKFGLQGMLGIINDIDVNKMNALNGRVLAGYFQNPNLFGNRAGQFETEVIRNLKPWRDAVMQEIELQPEDIVLHVRRGDYLQVQAREYHGLLDAHYYRRSIVAARDLGMNGKVIAVSDDPTAARLLLENAGIEVTWCSQKHQSLYDLALMSMASTLIIGNSSFSWWGARLSREANVICPSPWFKSLASGPSPALPNWLKIEIDYA